MFLYLVLSIENQVWVDLDDDMDFSLPVSQHTTRCPLHGKATENLLSELKKWESYNGFEGQILNYDPTSGQYGVFFPSDDHDSIATFIQMDQVASIHHIDLLSIL